jgi:hypothetical protein
MRGFYESHSPPDPGLTCLLSPARFVLKEDLAGNGKYALVPKPLQQWPDEIQFHLHIVVQQNHNIIVSRLDTGVIAPGKAHIPRQGYHFNSRVMSL